MDGGTFDRVTRVLAGRLTRRTGASAALAGLFGLAGSGGALRVETPQAAAKRRAGERAPGAQGEVDDEKKPCGPKARDNRCRKDKDCCTRSCKKPKKGSTAKVGRCRCVKPGKKCKNGQKCCGGARCQNRKCTIQPVPATCTASGGACASNATCCTGLVCQDGACGPCVAAVCASGCAHTTVNAAYAAAAAGATLYIGPGSYPTGIEVDKDITLAACPGVTGVELVVDRQVRGADSYYAILAEDANDTNTYSVTLRNLALKGTLPTNVDDALLNAGANGRVDFTLEDCRASDTQYLLYVPKGGTHRVTRLAATNFGYGIYFSGAPVVDLTVEDSQFTDGLDSYCALYGFQAVQATVAVSGSTVSGGSGGFYASMTQSGSFTVTDSSITGAIGETPLGFFGVQDGATRANTTATFTNVTVDGCSYGPYVGGGVIAVNDSAFTNNGDTYGYFEIINTTLTLTDTTISGNTSSYYDAGGGIYAVCSGGYALYVTFAGTTTVEGNSVTGWGGGVAVSRFGGAGGCPSFSFTNVTTTNVKSNTATLGGPQCAVCTVSGTCNSTTFVNVADCNFNSGPLRGRLPGRAIYPARQAEPAPPRPARRSRCIRLVPRAGCGGSGALASGRPAPRTTG
ncbi:MAG: hypothetical protein ACKOWF_10050, partial [Chloroflexota bacterium]